MAETEVALSSPVLGRVHGRGNGPGACSIPACMAALYIALPVALLLAAAGVAAFVWSVRSGQLDDLDTPAVRPLVDDDDPG